MKSQGKNLIKFVYGEEIFISDDEISVFGEYYNICLSKKKKIIKTFEKDLEEIKTLHSEYLSIGQDLKDRDKLDKRTLYILRRLEKNKRRKDYKKDIKLAEQATRNVTGVKIEKQKDQIKKELILINLKLNKKCDELSKIVKKLLKNKSDDFLGGLIQPQISNLKCMQDIAKKDLERIFPKK